MLKGECQVIWRGRLIDSLNRHQIGMQRVADFAGDVVKRRVGHGRVQGRQHIVRAVGQDLIELGRRHTADARRFVRCDVDRIQTPERCVEGKTTRESLAPFRRVTRQAIAGRREVLAGGYRLAVSRRRMVGNTRYTPEPGEAGVKDDPDDHQSDQPGDPAHPSRLWSGAGLRVSGHAWLRSNERNRCNGRCARPELPRSSFRPDLL